MTETPETRVPTPAVVAEEARALRWQARTQDERLEDTAAMLEALSAEVARLQSERYFLEPLVNQGRVADARAAAFQEAADIAERAAGTPGPRTMLLTLHEVYRDKAAEARKPAVSDSPEPHEVVG